MNRSRSLAIIVGDKGSMETNGKMPSVHAGRSFEMKDGM